MNQLLKAEKIVSNVEFEAMSNEEKADLLLTKFSPERAKATFIQLAKDNVDMKIGPGAIGYLTNGKVKTPPTSHAETIAVAEKVSGEVAKKVVHALITRGDYELSPKKLLELSHGRIEVEGVERPRNTLDKDLIAGLSLKVSA